MMKRRTNKQTIYYAHCMADYDTEVSQLHIKLLKGMGFKVIDPSSKRYERVVDQMKADGKTSSEIMDYFVTVVKECDHLAFRALEIDDNHGNIVSAGVGKEIDIMKKKGGSVIQMPDLYKKSMKTMSVEDTKAYIRKSR